jgi:hypothetical protein
VSRGPLAVGIVGVAHVVGRRKAPFPASVHQERDVLRVVVLVAHDDIEHHPAEHLLRILVGEPQTAHHSERLFVGVGPVEPIIEVRDAAKRLHVHLYTVYPVEPLCQEMSPPVLFDQRAFRHVDSAFLHKTREGVFQTPEVLRLPESGRGGYAVQLDDVVVEPVGSLELSRTDLSGGFVVGNDCLGTLPAGRSAEAQNFCNGRLFVGADVHVET